MATYKSFDESDPSNLGKRFLEHKEEKEKSEQMMEEREKFLEKV